RARDQGGENAGDRDDRPAGTSMRHSDSSARRRDGICERRASSGRWRYGGYWIRKPTALDPEGTTAPLVSTLATAAAASRSVQPHWSSGVVSSDDAALASPPSSSEP